MSDEEKVFLMLGTVDINAVMNCVEDKCSRFTRCLRPSRIPGENARLHKSFGKKVQFLTHYTHSSRSVSSAS